MLSIQGQQTQYEQGHPQMLLYRLPSGIIIPTFQKYIRQDNDVRLSWAYNHVLKPGKHCVKCTSVAITPKTMRFVRRLMLHLFVCRRVSVKHEASSYRPKLILLTYLLHTANGSDKLIQFIRDGPLIKK